MSSIMRAVIDAIIPPGSFWRVAPGKDLDSLYDGIADCWEPVRVFLEGLKNTRNPENTEFLDELEQEFGTLTNPSLTEAQRREQLKPSIYNRDKSGGIDDLQNALNSAGFSVQVHANDPAVDPALFVTSADLLVNGDMFTEAKAFTTISGNLNAVCGAAGAQCGSYSGIAKTAIFYDVPPDSADWPMVFFVGGNDTRDGSGALTAIAAANVPAEQQPQFERIILKYKPIHSWAGLVINYV